MIVECDTRSPPKDVPLQLNGDMTGHLIEYNCSGGYWVDLGQFNSLPGPTGPTGPTVCSQQSHVTERNKLSKLNRFLLCMCVCVCREHKEMQEMWVRQVQREEMVRPGRTEVPVVHLTFNTSER